MPGNDSSVRPENELPSVISAAESVWLTMPVEWQPVKLGERLVGASLEEGQHLVCAANVPFCVCAIDRLQQDGPSVVPMQHLPCRRRLVWSRFLSAPYRQRRCRKK